MSAKLDEILKDVLSGMSDEDFARCFSEVSDLGGASIDNLRVLNEKLIEYETNSKDR